MDKIGDRAPYHIEQIAAFCRAHPIQRKILLSPSRQVGYNILSHLSQTGIEWVNLEAMSASDLAELEFGPQLRSRGLRRIAGDDVLVLLHGILGNIKDRNSHGYFEPVSVTPSLLRSVWLTLSSIRMAGTSAADVGRKLPSGAKREALRDLIDGFEAAIESNRWYDPARLLSEIDRPRRLHARFAILEETALTTLEKQFIDRVAGTELVVIGRPDFGVPRPESSAGVRYNQAPHAASESESVGRAGQIYTSGLEELDRSSVTVWGARGVDQEVKDVLRWALSNDVRFDQIELAYSRPATYLPALVDLTDRFGVDVAFGDGIPVTLTRPGRGLRGVLQWILDGYPVDGLAGLLQAGLFQFDRQSDEPATGMPNLASLLLEAPIGERIDRYAGGLSALLADVDHRLETVEPVSRIHEALSRRRAEVERLNRGLVALETLVPKSEQTRLSEIAKLCLAFLGSNAAVGDDGRDRIAQESLSERVEQYRDDPTLVPTTFAVQMFADMLDRHTIQVSTAQPGALYAVDLQRAGYSGRSYLFVIGLDVDSFPGRISEDPILLDLERERVSANLGRRSLEAGDRIWHLVRALGMAPGRVFLGTTAFDPEREDTIVYPSPFIQTVAGQLGFKYDALPGLGHTSTLDDVDLLVPQRDRVDFRRTASALYPWLPDGQQAVDQRRSPVFSRFDGWLGSADPNFRISEGGPVFSNTRFERLADCGYRYFLTDILRLRRPEYYELDPARWLPAKDFGLLLHELYHDFLAKVVDAGERVEPGKHRPMAFELLDAAIEEYKERFPIDNLAAYRFQVQRLRQSVETFLRTEALSDSTPIRFELTFGYPDAAVDDLRSPVLIDLGDGRKFLLSGRIDRVDDSDQGLIVWDYKTGSSWRFKKGDLLRGGLNLQWALYSAALERFASRINLAGVVSASGYYFASDREHGLKRAERPLSIEELRGVVGPLIDLVNTGAFLKVHKDDGACMFCDFKPVCSREALKKRDMADRWEANRDSDFHDALNRWMSFDAREDLKTIGYGG